MRISARAERIEPFYVMEVAKAAASLAQTLPVGVDPVLALNIGEPDFTAPPLVQEAAVRAIRDGATHYTHATGLPDLRERISQWYLERFKVTVSANRIVVTAGASAALQLACLALIEAGDQILMPDPSYPCNRHFVTAADGQAVLLPTTAAQRFQLSADQVEAAWMNKAARHSTGSRGVLLASPSNPTGTSMTHDELRRIHAFVASHDGVTLVDEIYLGLSFEEQYGRTALSLGEDIISINSFSKYFSMTGWRLGWLVLPPALVAVVERLAQNLFICPSAIAQHAALACFEADSLAEYERRRAEFKARRDYFIPALNALGLSVPVASDGAFYAWADGTQACQQLGLESSWELAFDMLQKAHVAVAPGRDFSPAQGHRFIRFSTANSLTQLQQAIARLKIYLSAKSTT